MRKPIVKTAGLLLLALLTTAAVLVVNLVWFRPFSLNLFYEKVFIQVLLQSPELLTQLGIAEQFGYRRHNAHLDDASTTKTDQDAAAWRVHLADLQAYGMARQTPQQQLSSRVLAWYIQAQVDGERFRFHDYPVNQLQGVQSQTPDFLINQHRIDDLRGAEDYLARLGELGRKFDQVQGSLAHRERLGVLPPRFVLTKVLAEMRSFADQPAQDNPLYRHFARKLAVLPGLPADQQQALLARCAQVLDAGVRPAYRKLITHLDGQRSRATDDDGAWKLPDGAAYYAWRLRIETSSRMTPDQVHALGLAEVARIDAEMLAILRAQGQLQPGETAARAMTRLAGDPRFLYPDTDTGRQTALADYRRMIADQLLRSRALFGRLPPDPIEVQRVPEFKQATAPGAYYMPPALDGKRPGVFYANLRNMAELPTFGMRTLSVHEGVPGHHFQIALAQAQQGGPTFRKVLPFTAYQEGWALYAEWLGSELGLYQSDPFGDLGRLQAEMFRAVRLVVDTGMHAQRWPRQRAVDYMLANTGMAQGEVVAEIERYIVDPGQACAYKVGMLAIRAARSRAQQALGPRWDAQALKDFHDVVLGSGALPLEIMDELVDSWVKTRLSPAPSGVGS